MLCWLSQPDAPVLSFSSFFSTSRVITLFYLFSFSCCKYLFSTFRSLIHLEFTFSAGGSDLVLFVFPLRKVNFKNMMYYISVSHIRYQPVLYQISTNTHICVVKNLALTKKSFSFGPGLLEGNYRLVIGIGVIGIGFIFFFCFYLSKTYINKIGIGFFFLLFLFMMDPSDHT